MCVCGRDWKWKREKATCHHRGGIHRAIMVIPVAIWALQKARDRLSAMTRARLRGEVERGGDGGQTAISLSSSVSLSQRILKASLSQVVASSILCLSLLQACNVKGMNWKKRNNSITPSRAQFYFIHSLSRSMCTLLVYTRARCLNVTTRSLDARCICNSCIILTSSSSLSLPLVALSSRYPTQSFGYCFLHWFLKSENYLSAMSSWSFRKRKGMVAVIWYHSRPLNCQGAHWGGTYSSSFLKMYVFVCKDEAASAAWDVQSAAVDLNWQKNDPTELKGALFIKLLSIYSLND